MRSIVLLGLYCLAVISPTLAKKGGPRDGYDANWWTPDIIIKKQDPLLYMSSDEGQPSGEYNWNADQFKLMGREKRTCDGCTEDGKHVIVQNQTLFVEDEEFFIRAVCYIPTPLGIESMNPINGQGGGGLCSPRRTPFAAEDFRSACYDRDFYDGGLDHPERSPPGPREGWFTKLWQRDFGVIKETGANAIRIYSSNPVTRLYTEQVLKGELPVISGNIVAPPLGKDHRPFMAAAHDAGLKVIFPLLGESQLLIDTPVSEFKQYLKNQIDEVGNHPALLMYILGNELPSLIENPSLLDKVNMYIGFARNYSMHKWGRSVPFSHAIGDEQSAFAYAFTNLDVDIFTANAGYRGTTFKNLWAGSSSEEYPGLAALSDKYNKPHFIGEMGWKPPARLSSSEAPKGWFNSLWKNLLDEGAPSGCIGGAFFEYMDEPGRKEFERTMGMVKSRVSTDSDSAAVTTEADPLAQAFSYMVFIAVFFL